MVKPNIITNFCDVFRYKEEMFVYFAEYNDIIYAARILDEEITQELNKVYGRVNLGAKPDYYKIKLCAS